MSRPFDMRAVDAVWPDGEATNVRAVWSDELGLVLADETGVRAHLQTDPPVVERRRFTLTTDSGEIVLTRRGGCGCRTPLRSLNAAGVVDLVRPSPARSPS
jgi:hypothetical protein